MNATYLVRMKQTLCCAALIGSTWSAAADWPQWRGPNRDGVAPDSPPLATEWEGDGPPLVWEADILPREGGEGSPVIAQGRVYVFANEPRDTAAVVRTLDARFYRELQWFDPDRVDAETLANIEAARDQGVPTELKEPARKAWIDAWIEKHIGDDRNLQRLAQRRLTRGDRTVSVAGMRMLKGVRDRTFGSEAVFLNWLDDNDVTDEDRETILAALPDTVREAKDVVFCVDAATGEPRWETVLAGRPESRIGSSTPTVVDGRLYVFGTTHAHCLDAATGDPVWSRPLPQPTSASSPLVTGDTVIGLGGTLVAFDRASGDIRWENKEVKGRKSSPVAWHDRVLVHADGSRRLFCVNPADGSIDWEVPGGGDSTPALLGKDFVGLHIKTGLRAYRPYADRAELAWEAAFEDTRGASSPLFAGGRLIGFPTTGAAAFDPETGAELWSETFKSGIISPILADGKIIHLSNGGQFGMMLDADDGTELCKFRIKGNRCASAAFANGLLVVRARERLACYDLR